MPQQPERGTYIDLKKIIDHLILRWMLFAISIAACLIIAFIYLKVTPKLYPVKASLQVMDQFTSDKSSGGERFISGQELLAGNPELEDEIGILSSYSLIEKALSNLDFNVSYYKYRTGMGSLGKKFAKEIYKKEIKVVLDTSHFQLINTPVYVTFPDESHYRVTVNSSSSTLYDLADENPVKKNIDASIDQTLPITTPFKNEYMHFFIRLDSVADLSSSGYYFIVHSNESLVKAYSSKVKINPISKDANIVNLTINSTIPEKEIDFLNALSNEYIQNDLMKENQLGLKTLEFIDYQLSHIYDSLEMVERSLKSFRQANRIVDISTTSNNYNSQLDQLEEEQARILVQQKYLQFTLDNLKKNDGNLDIVTPSSVGLNDPFLNNLMVQLSDLNKERISKSYSSGPNSLVSKVLIEKIENTKAALKENVNNLLNSTRISLQQNKQRMNKTLSLINELPQSERDLTSLNRKFAFNDNVYNYLLEKRVEAGIALASNLPDKNIIDDARLLSNEPVSPNKTLILLGAALLGFTIPIGIILVQKFMDTSISGAADAEGLVNLQVIGKLPQMKKMTDKKLVIFDVSERLKKSIQFLITDLKQDYDLATNNVIGITSFEQGDGKTFATVSLASNLAKLGQRVLILDTDISRSDLKTYFPSTDQQTGLMEFLASDRDPKYFISNTPFNKMHYIAVGKNVNNGDKTLLLFENKFEVLFTYLKKNYDVVIVDTPAFTETADYFLLSRFFSISFVVVRHKKTTKAKLEEGISSLTRKNIKNLKLLYNDVPVTA